MNRHQRRQNESHARQAQIHFQGYDYTIPEACAFAVQQQTAGHSTIAADMYRLILVKDPKHTTTLNNLGLILYEDNQVEEAIALYRRAASADPLHAIVRHNLGDALVSKAHIAEGEHMFLQALSLRPDFPKALFSLTSIRKYQSPDHPDAQHIRALLNHPQCPAEDREHLYSSLAKIYEDCELYDEAFHYYKLANDHYKDIAIYNPQVVEELTAQTRAIFTRQSMAQPFEGASQSQQPVFIIGMPRSGTTLIANILSNHPAITAVGELPTMIECAAHFLPAMAENIPYPQAARHMTAHIAGQLTAIYEKRLHRDAPAKSPFIIDKHPINFRYIGFINRLYPRAHIIHCTRDPIDTCLSNYFQRFAPDYAYSFNLDNTAHFYNEYTKLIQHWRDVLPIPMLEISYEETVANTEQVARKALGFLGLEWDERCLAPHTNPRAVRTASVWQVRQPVYTHSVERWRRFEKHLGPLRQFLPVQL